MKPLENTVVNCRTQEESDECMRLFKSFGWKRWSLFPTDLWDMREEKTCYRIDGSRNYSDISYYVSAGFKVISFQELKSMAFKFEATAKEPKYKVGDVVFSKDGEKNTVESVEIEIEFGYRFDTSHILWYEDEIEDWKLQEPVEEMTLAQVCKELGRTIKIVK